MRALRALVVLLAVLAFGGCGADGGPATDGRAGGARTDAAPPSTAAAPAGQDAQDALPAVGVRLPGGPEGLAGALEQARREAGAAARRWRTEGDLGRALPPRDLARWALVHQRIVRRLARQPRLERRVLARVDDDDLAAETRDLVAAPRALGQIVSVRRGPPPRIRTARSVPAERLRRAYSRGLRRFGVGPPLLAGVNFVETAFGKLRNRSISGAQGPMQFIPETWAAFGLGGDIRDTEDAILGAANYLHANGAPGNERRALYRYNPSDDYVDAVSRYTRRMRADPDLFYVLYAWQVYTGGRRATSFGL